MSLLAAVEAVVWNRGSTPISTYLTEANFHARQGRILSSSISWTCTTVVSDRRKLRGRADADFHSIILGPVPCKVPRCILLAPEDATTIQYFNVILNHRAYRRYSKPLYISSSATLILHATGKGVTQMGLPFANPAFTVQKRPCFPA